MSENYKLPGSSYEEFVKIVKAYSTGKVGVPMSLDTIAQTTGMDKTIVSRNNGFLMQLHLVSEGNKKAPTQEGFDLGRAYSLRIDEQIVRCWRTLIEGDEFLSRMLSAIKIRNGMDKTGFINHIIYSSGSSNNNNTRAGASTIVEIFKVAGFVQETDGKIMANEENETQISTVSPYQDNNTMSNDTSVISSKVISQPVYKNGTASITLNININVNVNEMDDLTEKLKKLLESFKV